MDYQETNREDFNAENIQNDEIPVATVTDEEADRLIPADPAAYGQAEPQITSGNPHALAGARSKGVAASAP